MTRPTVSKRSQVSDGLKWAPATLREAATYYACYIVAMAAHLAAAGQALRRFRGVSLTEGHPGECHALATADLEARPPLLARPGSCILALRTHCDICGPDAHASTSYVGARYTGDFWTLERMRWLALTLLSAPTATQTAQQDTGTLRRFYL